jgi:ApaG protein
MATSSCTTRGIRIGVEARFSAEHSAPARQHWFFLYTVTVANEGEVTVQLESRHWVIADATGRVENVRGPGVVGEQPVLMPGESFEYTSGCPLTTPTGEMRGSYTMVTPTGERFEAVIAPFRLQGPYTVH